MPSSTAGAAPDAGGFRVQRSPVEDIRLHDFRHWKPEVQEQLLEKIREREQAPWRPFYCRRGGCNGHPHCAVIQPQADRDCQAPEGHRWTEEEDDFKVPGVWHCHACGILGTLIDDWAWEHARADQHPPRWGDPWLTWLLAGGRGSGKTRTGAEITHHAAEISPRLILIAPTGPDLRETMIEGVSGIKATAPPGKMPVWEPSKKKLTWPNGAIAQGFSAEEPDRLRGPQSGYIWADEPAHYPDTEAVWSNMLFGHRVKNKRGFRPKIVATSTPKPTKWMKELVADEKTKVTTVSTFANLANLSDTFRETVSRYEGTRIGLQELEGQLLGDVEGAMWDWDMYLYEEELPTSGFKRVVIGLDPAGSANKRSDETGIIVVALDHSDDVWVLADYTGKYSPAGWAGKAIHAFETWEADEIVVEKNYGGDMVRHTLETSAEGKGVLASVKDVDSRRGKAIRATPVVALYEKKKVRHLVRKDKTGLAELREEQTTWEPAGNDPSPNRIDAEVHAITRIAKQIMPSAVTMPHRTRGEAGGFPALTQAGFSVARSRPRRSSISISPLRRTR